MVKYLVIVDRCSAWLSIHKVAGSRGLVKTLKEHFATVGIPDKLATDGGPEFIAGATQSFLKRWGTKHSLFSAYFPHSTAGRRLGKNWQEAAQGEHRARGGVVQRQAV